MFANENVNDKLTVMYLSTVGHLKKKREDGIYKAEGGELFSPLLHRSPLAGGV